MANGSTRPAALRFRLKTAYGIRIFGVGCVALAVVVALWMVRSAVPFADNAVGLVVLLLLTIPAAGVVAVGVALLVGRPYLAVDAEGLVNRTGLGVGVRRLTWDQVADIGRAEGSLVITLSDGRTSTVNVAVLDADTETIEAAIGERADRAFGYKPLNG